MKSLMLPALFLATLSLAVPAAADEPSFDTTARNAIVIDYQTGAVMLAKNADQRIPTASMSKIMTAYTVYGYLASGKAKLDDMLPVSEAAWRTGGSKMFVPYPGEVKVSDLLQGMIVQSGNDACIVLAEGLAGSQQAFVEKMNENAKKLGLTNSHFGDVDGLPTPDHYMSVRDLATLSRDLIHDYPQFYTYEAEKDYTYNGIKQGNRNPLLYKNSGADGIKTGHTEEAGFGLTASVKRGDRRIIMVATGLGSMKGRSQEAEKIVDYAFREFQNFQIAKQGDELDQAQVWLGDKSKVPLVAAGDLVVTMPRASRKDMKVTVSYDGPIKAPVTAGQQVGSLVVTVPDMPDQSVPIITGGAVGALGPMGRVGAALSHMIWGAKG